MKRPGWIIMLIVGLSLLSGCGVKTEEPGAAAETRPLEIEAEEENTKAEATETIFVAAAASLKNVYEEKLIPMFQALNPEIRVSGIYDSSGKLQTQIQEGLEVDVFMPAAGKPMEALDEEGLIASETVIDLLENKIVMIVPADSQLGLARFADITKAEIIALGDPASVPAGEYAQEALTYLGVWEEIQAKVSFGTNVTEVLNQVASSSAEAGIVYATDAAGMKGKVSIIAEAPEESLDNLVVYPVAVVKDSLHREAAEIFVEFLQSAEAIDVFQSYGFSVTE